MKIIYFLVAPFDRQKDMGQTDMGGGKRIWGGICDIRYLRSNKKDRSRTSKLANVLRQLSTRHTRGNNPRALGPKEIGALEKERDAIRADMKQRAQEKRIAKIMSDTAKHCASAKQQVEAATRHVQAFFADVDASGSSADLRTKANELMRLSTKRAKKEGTKTKKQRKRENGTIAFLPLPGGVWSQNGKGYFVPTDVENGTHVLVHIKKFNNDGSVIIEYQDPVYEGDDDEKRFKQMQLQAAKANTLCYNPSFVGKTVRMRKGKGQTGHVVEDAVAATGDDTDELMVKWSKKTCRARLGDIDILREEEAALRLGVLVETCVDKGSTPKGWQGKVTQISNKSAAMQGPYITEMPSNSRTMSITNHIAKKARVASALVGSGGPHPAAPPNRVDEVRSSSSGVAQSAAAKLLPSHAGRILRTGSSDVAQLATTCQEPRSKMVFMKIIEPIWAIEVADGQKMFECVANKTKWQNQFKQLASGDLIIIVMKGRNKISAVCEVASAATIKETNRDVLTSKLQESRHEALNAYLDGAESFDYVEFKHVFDCRCVLSEFSTAAFLERVGLALPKTPLVGLLRPVAMDAQWHSRLHECIQQAILRLPVRRNEKCALGR